MTIQKINPRNLWVTAFIVVIAAIRVAINMNGQLHPLTNFSAIGAMALFGAAYFSKRIPAFAVPLLTLFVSDMILALTVYSKYSHGILYSGWYWVYGAFALMVIAGKLIIREVSFKNVLLAAVAITFIHWIVSDIGVWLNGSTYPKTMAGCWACLAAAIPFERNFLLGTLFYSGIMFGCFEWMKKHRASLDMAQANIIS
ncbi:MAG: DUF6580 family putative transport protein [Chitinophagaceae bacterium]